MQIVINIGDDVYKRALVYKDVQLASNKANDLSELITAVANGTPLPKNHGRLIDADAFERRCMFDNDIEDMQDLIYALRGYKPIIEADKEVENDT